jgi:hypothetical protein
MRAQKAGRSRQRYVYHQTQRPSIFCITHLSACQHAIDSERRPLSRRGNDSKEQERSTLSARRSARLVEPEGVVYAQQALALVIWKMMMALHEPGSPRLSLVYDETGVTMKITAAVLAGTARTTMTRRTTLLPQVTRSPRSSKMMMIQMRASWRAPRERVAVTMKMTTTK